MSSKIFKKLSLLSDPMRVRLLRLLSLESCTVGEIVDIIESPQSTVSRHLKALTAMNWLSKKSVGASSWYVFNPEELPKSEQQLWSLVNAEADEMFPRDKTRLRSIVAMRHTDSAEFFKRIGQKWSELRVDLFGDEFLLQAISHLLPPHLVIADLGCGNGDTLSVLAPVVQKVIGVDRSPEMLSLCKEISLAYPNIDLRQGSIEELPINSGEIDLAFCLLVLHHIDDLQRAFHEIARSLKKGGRLIIVDMKPHHRDDFQFKMGHKQLGFSKKRIEASAKAVDMRLVSWKALVKSPAALGPELFLSVLEK